MAQACINLPQNYLDSFSRNRYSHKGRMPVYSYSTWCYCHAHITHTHTTKHAALHYTDLDSYLEPLSAIVGEVGRDGEHVRVVSHRKGVQYIHLRLGLVPSSMPHAKPLRWLGGTLSLAAATSPASRCSVTHDLHCKLLNISGGRIREFTRHYFF